MKDIDKAVIIVSVLVVLAFLCFFVKWVNADEPYLDDSGCNMHLSDTMIGKATVLGYVDHAVSQGYGGHYADCYAPKIYAQNEKIIQQNEQIIKLQVTTYCMNPNNIHDLVYYNGTLDEQKTLNQCIDSLENMTK